LANAIDFEAQWAKGVDPVRTRNDDLHVDADTTVSR